MFIQKSFWLTTEEINAFSTVHSVLKEICENSQCDSCILKQYCNSCFKPSYTIRDVKQLIVNEE